MTDREQKVVFKCISNTWNFLPRLEHLTTLTENAMIKLTVIKRKRWLWLHLQQQFFNKAFLTIFSFFRRIYPNGNAELYEKYFAQCGSLCTETAASKARQECAR